VLVVVEIDKQTVNPFRSFESLFPFFKFMILVKIIIPFAPAMKPQIGNLACYNQVIGQIIQVKYLSSDATILFSSGLGISVALNQNILAAGWKKGVMSGKPE
jgi:hypothetical protein